MGDDPKTKYSYICSSLASLRFSLLRGNPYSVRLTSVSTSTAWAVLSLSPSLFGGAVVADFPGSLSSFLVTPPVGISFSFARLAVSCPSACVLCHGFLLSSPHLSAPTVAIRSHECWRGRLRPRRRLLLKARMYFFFSKSKVALRKAENQPGEAEDRKSEQDWRRRRRS